MVLLPLNVSFPLPAELAVGSEAVWEALRDDLRARGTDLKTLARSDARALWVESLREARAAGRGTKVSFEQAARHFVRRISEHASFRAVMMPTLFVQSAEISDDRARWDGVERDVEIVDREKLPDGVRLTEGVAPAASLHLVVLGGEGETLHEAQTGLELLVRVRARRTGDFEFVPRERLFSDPQVLSDGVARALAPFLPPRAEEGRVR